MKKLTGVIISDKMDKTRVVAIASSKRHRLYHKSYSVTTKIKAHDEGNVFKQGETVEIIPVKPISRDKAWKIVRKIEK